MNFKKYILLFSIFLVLIVAITSVSATEDILNDSQTSNIDDMDLIELSECTSVILHVDENESVISHRRDSTGAADIFIVEDNYNGIDFIKQYKTADGYFAHVIVTSNGWVIGNGGVTDGDVFKQIEKLSLDIVASNKIDEKSVLPIYNILSKYSLGHFVIKAPDGSYCFANSNHYDNGKLIKGQAIVLPNVYSYSKRTMYDSTLNPVDASIKLTSLDNYGINRRDIVTYDYKLSLKDGKLVSTVDYYVSNDNGKAVGLSTGGLADNVHYFGKYIAWKDIPQTPGKLLLGTYTFNNTSENVFELVEPVQTAIVGEDVVIKYKVNYIKGENPVIQFNIPEGYAFDTAELSKGDYVYDSNTNILTWNLNNCDNVNYLTLKIKANRSVSGIVYSNVLNTEYSFKVNVTTLNSGVKLIVKDVEKYYGDSERLNIFLKNLDDEALVNQSISITIVGITYTRTTDENGMASIALNLNPGNYKANVSYNGRFGKDSKLADIKILSTVNGKDITKYYLNGTQYYATFLDINGNPLANKEVHFNICGVFYTRTTDENGVAKLNINLSPGEYIITAINPVNGDKSSNLIKVLPTIVGSDLNMSYRDGSVYECKLVDGQGNPIKGVEVTFNIVGVFYTRLTDDNGVARLNINLLPGKYIITAYYGAAASSNTIIVAKESF